MREFIRSIGKNPYLSLRDWELQIADEKKQSIITTDESSEIVKDLSLKSFSGGYKILIIWHANKLGVEAQNKLLKTLEEPQPKTLIILISDFPDGLLPTIISRTQLVKFNRLNDEEIAQALNSEFDISSEKAMNIARITDGNYAQARQLVELDLNTSEYLEIFSKWMRAAAVQDFHKLILSCDVISKFSRDDQQSFIEYGLNFLHQCVLHEYVGKDEARFDSQEKELAHRFAPFMVKQNLSGFHDVFSKGHYLVKRNVNPHLLFLKMGNDMVRLFKEHTPQHNS